MLDEYVGLAGRPPGELRRGDRDGGRRRALDLRPGGAGARRRRRRPGGRGRRLRARPSPPPAASTCSCSASAPTGTSASTSRRRRFASRTRIKTLAPRTRADNARFFDGDVDEVPTHCLTQGLGDDHRGPRTCCSWRRARPRPRPSQPAVEGPLRAMCPASALQLHPRRHGAGRRRGRAPPAAGRLLPLDVRAQAGLAAAVGQTGRPSAHTRCTCQSRSRTTTSAAKPGWMRPMRSCSPRARAGVAVSAVIASTGVRSDADREPQGGVLGERRAGERAVGAERRPPVPDDDVELAQPVVAVPGAGGRHRVGDQRDPARGRGEQEPGHRGVHVVAVEHEFQGDQVVARSPRPAARDAVVQAGHGVEGVREHPRPGVEGVASRGPGRPPCGRRPR